MKLIATSEDPILEQKIMVVLIPVIIDGEKEWEFKEISNSQWHQKRLQYLIKWKEFSLENNYWEDTLNVLALDQVAKFHLKHLDAPRHIFHIKFEAIFKPPTIASSCSNLRENRCKRTSFSKTFIFHVFWLFYVLWSIPISTLIYLSAFQCFKPLQTTC